MQYYYRSQLTSSNGHVTGIDSPMPDYPVANPTRHEPLIQRLVEGGIELIEKEEERIKGIKINSLIDADARIIGFSYCK